MPGGSGFTQKHPYQLIDNVHSFKRRRASVCYRRPHLEHCWPSHCAYCALCRRLLSLPAYRYLAIIFHRLSSPTILYRYYLISICTTAAVNNLFWIAWIEFTTNFFSATLGASWWSALLTSSQPPVSSLNPHLPPYPNPNLQCTLTTHLPPKILQLRTESIMMIVKAPSRTPPTTPPSQPRRHHPRSTSSMMSQ